MRSSLPWRGGDLYIEGKVLGHGVREKIMTPAAWINAGGLAHQTFKNCGSVCARFPREYRHEYLSFAHHAAVSMRDLPLEVAHRILSEAARQGWSDFRTRVEAKRHLSGYYNKYGSDIAKLLDDLIRRRKRFNAICPDCPWLFAAALVFVGLAAPTMRPCRSMH